MLSTGRSVSLPSGTLPSRERRFGRRSSGLVGHRSPSSVSWPHGSISCFLRPRLLGAQAVRAPPSRYHEVYSMGEPTNTEGRSRPVRVLLADNHAMFRQSVASMLSKDGTVEVVGDADNGPQAIELAKHTRPDVIVMQVEQEPEEAATEIKGMLEASPDSRIVVLTVYQDPRRVKEMVGLGTSAYVHKSATVEELLGTVRRATQGSPEGERDYAVVGMPERIMEQVVSADESGISARE